MHKSATLLAAVLLALPAAAQTQSNDMPGMDMSHSTGGDHMQAMPSDNGASAMSAMAGNHMDMGPHMKMTALRPLQPGDAQRADQVLQAARATVERYQDYKVALADGYKIFLPNVPQKMYHFSNSKNGFYARNHFDPSRPTSLLYEKHGDDYKLIGVMYTAKKDASEDELNSRIPLSIAQWHAHVNFCIPTRRSGTNARVHDGRFGFAGSIATRDECAAAGGLFFPQVLGWMVHVYPFEQKPADTWSVERQHNQQD